MPYKLQESVSASGFYITLPDLYESKNRAVEALKLKESSHGTLRIVHCSRDYRGPVYEPLEE